MSLFRIASAHAFSSDIVIIFKYCMSERISFAAKVNRDDTDVKHVDSNNVRRLKRQVCAPSEAVDSNVDIENLKSSNHNVNRLRRQLRVLPSGSDEMSTSQLSISKINALKASLDKHNDTVSKVLLGSKDTLDKKCLLYNQLLERVRTLLSRYPLN